MSVTLPDPARVRVGPRRRVGAGAGRVLVALSGPLVIVAAWELTRALFSVPERTMPPAADILRYLTGELSSGEPVALFLARNIAATAQEALVGLAVAIVMGVGLAIAMVYLPRVSRGLLPVAIGSQSLPVLALAPPLLVWLGTGWQTKAAIAGYTAFFPLVVYTYRGLTSARPRLLALMDSYACSRRQSFWKVRVPSAVPHFFTALRVSASLSVIGAIVAELPVGAARGVGRVMFLAAQSYTFQPPALYGSAIAAMVLGICFFSAAVLLEALSRRLLGLQR